jgi:hypothetical protein
VDSKSAHLARHEGVDPFKPAGDFFIMYKPLLEDLLRSPMCSGQVEDYLAILLKTHGYFDRGWSGAAVSVSLIARLTKQWPTQVKRFLAPMIEEGVVHVVRPAKGSSPAILRVEPDSSRWGRFAPIAGTECDHTVNKKQRARSVTTAGTECDHKTVIAGTECDPLKILEEHKEEGRTPASYPQGLAGGGPEDGERFDPVAVIEEQLGKGRTKGDLSQGAPDKSLEDWELEAELASLVSFVYEAAFPTSAAGTAP